MATVINDGSTSYHTITFYDEDGSEVNPTTTEYKLLNSDKEIMTNWTSFAGNEVQVSASDNTVTVANGNRRYLTVRGTNGDSTVVTKEITYTIDDLTGVS